MSWKTRAVGMFLLAAALGAVGARAAEKPILNLSDQEWPPYYVDGRGFARELLQTCVPRAGYTPHFSVMPLEQLFSSLQSGLLDAHVLSHREGRDKFVLYGKVPLFRDAYRPVVRADSTIQIHKLSDFDGLRLGHMVGLRYSDEFLDYVRQRRRAGKLLEVEGNENILEALLANKIDVFVNLSASIRWLAKQRGDLNKIKVLDYEVKGADYYFAVSKASHRVKDRQGLLDAMDQCITDLKADGTYAKLQEEYGLQ